MSFGDEGRGWKEAGKKLERSTCKPNILRIEGHTEPKKGYFPIGFRIKITQLKC